MNATLFHPRLRKKFFDAASVSRVETPLEKTKLPFSGWIPGEKQYITGPFFTSGAIALQSETATEPSMTVACLAMMRFAACTALDGLDWSSVTTNLIGRPWMPPDLLVMLSMMLSACSASWPWNAYAPVAGMTASISNGGSAALLAGAAARSTVAARIANRDRIIVAISGPRGIAPGSRGRARDER